MCIFTIEIAESRSLW